MRYVIVMNEIYVHDLNWAACQCFSTGGCVKETLSSLPQNFFDSYFYYSFVYDVK